jgi:hypothetical protein
MSKSKIMYTEHSFSTSDPVVVSANVIREKIDIKRRRRYLCLQDYKRRNAVSRELYKQLEGFVSNLSSNHGGSMLTSPSGSPR